MDQDAKIELMSPLDELSTEDREFIAHLHADDVTLLHHGLGTLIRNRFRHGELRALLRWSRIQVRAGAGHLDDLSGPVMLEAWRVLKNAPDREQR